MKLSKITILAFLLTFSLVACNTSKKMTKSNEPYTSLRAELKSSAVVLKLGDTIKVIYPEMAMFDFGKDVVKTEAINSFVRFANIMKTYPDVNMIINGYTDNVGTDEINYDLSKRRAIAAFNLLKDDGVAESRMITMGRGPQHPINSNATDYGRAQNRRV
ncbi:MAG: OmpA family protein, partial [Chitinophagaceae bacterium]